MKMYLTSRAAHYCLAGHMRPVGRRLESPDLDGSHFKIQDGCQKQQPVTFQVFLLQY